MSAVKIDSKVRFSGNRSSGFVPDCLGSFLTQPTYAVQCSFRLAQTTLRLLRVSRSILRTTQNGFEVTQAAAIPHAKTGPQFRPRFPIFAGRVAATAAVRADEETVRRCPLPVSTSVFRPDSGRGQAGSTRSSIRRAAPHCRG